jgi:undecaprenyl-diphosphatase
VIAARDAYGLRMAFTTNHRTNIGRRSAFPARGATTSGSGLLPRIAEIDLAAVQRASDLGRSPAARHVAIFISRLGNGWIYPVLIAIVVAAAGSRGAPAIGVGALNAIILHAFYPLLKNYFRRRRPFRVDPRLSPLLPTLDEHSFPSGHAMTIVGVLTPLVLFWPATLLSAVMVAGAMAWSRVATAHHFPSDVAAGAALGLGLAYPLSSFALAFF